MKKIAYGIILSVLIFFVFLVYYGVDFSLEPRNKTSLPSRQEIRIESKEKYGQNIEGTDKQLLKELYSGDIKNDPDKYGKPKLFRKWEKIKRQTSLEFFKDTYSETETNNLFKKVRNDVPYLLERLKLHRTLYERNRKNMTDKVQCYWGGEILEYLEALIRYNNISELRSAEKQIISESKSVFQRDGKELYKNCKNIGARWVLVLMAKNRSFFPTDIQLDIVDAAIKMHKQRVEFYQKQQEKKDEDLSEVIKAAQRTMDTLMDIRSEF